MPRMASTIRPQFGARFELTLATGSLAEPTYEVRIGLPTQLVEGRLRLGAEEGRWLDELTTEPGPPLADWVTKHLAALGRQLFRDKQRTQAWPRRWLRWHESPEAAALRAAGAV